GETPRAGVLTARAPQVRPRRRPAARRRRCGHRACRRCGPQSPHAGDDRRCVERRTRTFGRRPYRRDEMERRTRTLTGMIFTIVCLALVAGLAAFSGPTSRATAAAIPDTLTVAYPLEPDTLNPYATHIPAVGDMGLAEGFV